jgi:hypothetical protein
MAKRPMDCDPCWCSDGHWYEYINGDTTIVRNELDAVRALLRHLDAAEPPPLPDGWEWTDDGAHSTAGRVTVSGGNLCIDDGCDAWAPLPAVAAALDAHRDPSWQVHIGKERDGVSLVRIVDGHVCLADPSNARAPLEVVRAVLARFWR